MSRIIHEPWIYARTFLHYKLIDKSTNRVNSSCIIPLIVYYALTPQNNVTGKTAQCGIELAKTALYFVRREAKQELPGK